MFNILGVFDHCGHAGTNLEVRFGLGLAIILGKYLDTFFTLRTHVQEII
jgi:hypothetical protein